MSGRIRLELLFVLFGIMALAMNGFGQEATKKLSPPEFKGYFKYLSIINNINLPNYSDVLTTQFVHHRLDTRWDIRKDLVLHVGWRNQVYLGDAVSMNAGFGPSLEAAQNDYLDLSANLIESGDIIWNSAFDRLYLEYYAGDLEISLGRQRINWGINTTWNPNDIFNAYSFVDFDYGERPGSDALLVRYHTGDLSSFEIASKLADEKEDIVIGGLYKFNMKKYDYQLLAGYANLYWTLGGGWAGNLGNAGWKGEWSLFIGDEEDLDNTFLVSTAVDYTFSSGFYLSGGYLYNHSGFSDESLSGIFAFEVNAQNLYPYRHSVVLFGSYAITPLLGAALTTVYSPNKNHPLFLFPNIGYSIARDWDLSFVVQTGFEKGESYFSPVQAFYLRLKLSY